LKKDPAVLVLGSLAFDHIMKLPYLFTSATVIDSNKNLNAAFTVHDIKVLRGGTGGNISYSLALLNAKCILISAAGKDFYERHYPQCFKNKVDLRIEIRDDQYSAAAFIISDSNNNQIIIFHEGALAALEYLDLKSKIKPDDQIKIAINAPNPVRAMVKYAHQLKELKIPMIFDPGQQIKNFTKEQLEELIPLTSILIFNSNELALFERTSERSINQLKDQIETIIVTLGSSGSVLYHKDEKFAIPTAKAAIVIDPTGAGDAYRAGLLKGILCGFSIKEACQLGAVMSSYCVEASGPQGHSCTLPDICERYKKHFGSLPTSL
jgi:adenosine kinase